MPTDVASLLLTYGPLGIITGLLLMGYVVPKPFYARLERENDRLRQALESERQRGDAGTQAAAASNQMLSALRTVVEEMRDDHRRRR